MVIDGKLRAHQDDVGEDEDHNENLHQTVLQNAAYLRFGGIGVQICAVMKRHVGTMFGFGHG